MVHHRAHHHEGDQQDADNAHRRQTGLATYLREHDVDEIHVMAATTRGAHLALSLERLDRLCEKPPQRISGIPSPDAYAPPSRPPESAGEQALVRQEPGLVGQVSAVGHIEAEIEVAQPPGAAGLELLEELPAGTTPGERYLLGKLVPRRADWEDTDHEGNPTGKDGGTYGGLERWRRQEEELEVKESLLL